MASCSRCRSSTSSIAACSAGIGFSPTSWCCFHAASTSCHSSAANRKAGDTGLFARQYAREVPELAVRHSGLVPDRSVAWERIRLVWDGEHFSVTRTKGTIEAKTARAAEPEPSDQEPE